MASTEELGDPYELLGVDEDAGDKEIQTAYRHGSLKVHPDRNPDDPEAAQKFDRLTRAKDLLLNPLERAAVDKQRRAKRELEERFAQEDAKRRKLREDLEGREEAAARAASAPVRRESLEEARRRFLQADTAARIKAREAKLAERQAEVVASVAEVKQAAAEARLLVRWRIPSTSTSTSQGQGEGQGDAQGEATRLRELRTALAGLDVRALDVTASGASVQMGSREDALRAVLQCRERRHQLPFRVTLDKGDKGDSGDKGEGVAGVGSVGAVGGVGGAGGLGGVGAPPGPANPANPANPGDTGEHPTQNVGQEPPSASKSKSNSKASAGSFSDWEAGMLDSLRGLAQAQREARVLST